MLITLCFSYCLTQLFESDLRGFKSLTVGASSYHSYLVWCSFVNHYSLCLVHMVWSLIYYLFSRLRYLFCLVFLLLITLITLIRIVDAFTPFSAIFQFCQCGQVYWCKKQEYLTCGTYRYMWFVFINIWFSFLCIVLWIFVCTFLVAYLT